MWPPHDNFLEESVLQILVRVQAVLAAYSSPEIEL